jgi:uncharacterized membrane protein
MGILENIINDYYVEPIWAHTGYNIVNTLTYAIIAIVAVFLIYRLIRNKIEINRHFIYSVLAFVLLGSTLRSVTDSIYSGVFTGVTPIHSWILDSGIYDYGYLTVSPGIYLVTAALLLLSLGVLYRMKQMEKLWILAIVLWIPHFLLLIPFMGYWIYAIPILILAAIPTYIAYWYFKDQILAAIVAGHALDGAATFFVIDIFSKISGIQYGEQHVFSAAIGNIGGSFFFFYLVKVAIAIAAAYLIRGEKMPEDEKRFIALVLMIMGFAPGIRDVLRMMLGA